MKPCLLSAPISLEFTHRTPATAVTARGSWSTCRRQVNMTDGTSAACTRPSRKYPDGRTGTSAGYLAHLKASEDACRPCKAAQAAKTAVRRGADAGKYGRYRRALADYEARVQAGEAVPVCAKPSPEYPAGRTGLRAGYHAHYFAGEDACPACLEGNRAAVAQDRIDDPDHVLRGNLWASYRLTLERYREICRSESPGDIRLGRFHVDHDHACCPGDKSCGECVRGLLCRACNTALGNFRDDPDVLVAALSYLLSHGKEMAS